MSAACPNGADKTMNRHKTTCEIFFKMLMTTPDEKLYSARRYRCIQAGYRFNPLMQAHAGTRVDIADHRPDIPQGPIADRTDRAGAYARNARITGNNRFGRNTGGRRRECYGV